MFMEYVIGAIAVLATGVFVSFETRRWGRSIPRSFMWALVASIFLALLGATLIHSVITRLVVLYWMDLQLNWDLTRIRLVVCGVVWFAAASLFNVFCSLLTENPFSDAKTSYQGSCPGSWVFGGALLICLGWVTVQFALSHSPNIGILRGLNWGWNIWTLKPWLYITLIVLGSLFGAAGLAAAVRGYILSTKGEFTPQGKLGTVTDLC